MTTALPSGGSNPYVGPRTFAYADRNRYFGREREARGLLARVVSERLLLFYAQSGAGKSSLINTRLIPQLRDQEGFSVLPVGRVAGELPDGVVGVDNIFLFNLMASLDQGSGGPARLARITTLSAFLEHLVTEDGLTWRYDPASADEDEAAGERPGPAQSARFALVIDQFEEIIAAHVDRWREREAFFQQLNQALLDNPNLWVVLTLRRDYVAALDPYAPLMFNRLRARFYMERMEEAAALEAVRRPARLAGRPFAPGVAEKLVEELRQVRVPGREETIPGQYVEPVQLQVVCYQLWERLDPLPGPPLQATPSPILRTGEPGSRALRPPARGRERMGVAMITEADLAEAGDVNQALEQFYAETLAAALAETNVREAGVTERGLRTWFDQELITETGIRNTVFRNDDAGRTGTMPNVVVDALARRFLLRSELRGGGAWAELIHDRFIEPIRQSNRTWFERNAAPQIGHFAVRPEVVTRGMRVSVEWSVRNADEIILDPTRHVFTVMEGTTEVTPAESQRFRLIAARDKGVPLRSDALPVTVLPESVEPTRIADAMGSGEICFVLGPEFEEAILSPISSTPTIGQVSDSAADLEEGWRQFHVTRVQRLLSEPHRNVKATPASPTSNQSAPQDLPALAHALGLANPTSAVANALLRIAQSPASVFLTAGFYPIVEAALQHVGKQPRCETCRWHPGLDHLRSVLDDHPTYSPTVPEPLVFHMYGSDRFPESLLLTENDYLTYLISVSENRERIPLLIRYVLLRNFNAILGFDIQSWAFRAFLHGVIADNPARRRGGFVQVLARGGTTEADIVRVEADLHQQRFDAIWGRAADVMTWLSNRT